MFLIGSDPESLGNCILHDKLNAMRSVKEPHLTKFVRCKPKAMLAWANNRPFGAEKDLFDKIQFLLFTWAIFYRNQLQYLSHAIFEGNRKLSDTFGWKLV